MILSEAIILRTSYYDSDCDSLIRSLQEHTGRIVVVVVDESNGVVDVPRDIKKVVIDPAVLGVLPHPQYGWRCGDYCLYAALRTLPQCSHFWIVEPDVRVHSSRVIDLLDGNAPSDAVDFITPWYVAASKEWVWYSTMSSHTQQVFNCMLQICRFSSRAAEYLLRRRRLLTRRFLEQKTPIELWPNDESFVGSEMASADFTVQLLSQHDPEFTTTGTLSFTRPTAATWLQNQPFDNRIYHPVVSGTKFHRRMALYLDSVQSLSGSESHEAIDALEKQAAFECQ